MAWADVGDTIYAITALKHGATSQLGPVAAVYEKIVEDEIIRSGADVNPTERPITSVDAIVRHTYFAADDFIAETTAAANCTLEFDNVDGDSGGSLVLGPMVPRGHRTDVRTVEGGGQQEQVFRHKGSSLTETYTL